MTSGQTEENTMKETVWRQHSQDWQTNWLWGRDELKLQIKDAPEVWSDSPPFTDIEIEEPGLEGKVLSLVSDVLNGRYLGRDV